MFPPPEFCIRIATGLGATYADHQRSPALGVERTRHPGKTSSCTSMQLVRRHNATIKQFFYNIFARPFGAGVIEGQPQAAAADH
jgi:hypothetical protein